MTTIELQGDLNVSNAVEVRKILVSALEKKQPIVFDVTKLEDMDVSIVQLLYSLYNSLDSNITISYTGKLSPLVKKRLYNIGVASSPNLTEDVLKVTGFENVKDCNTKIDVNDENQLIITLFLTVNENVVIKELASNLQVKIKDEVKKVSDLDVQEVNVKVMSIQENKKSKE